MGSYSTYLWIRILYRMTALFQVQDDGDGMTGVVDDETVMCNE